MSTPNPLGRPNEAAPVTLTELRAALAFVTAHYQKMYEDGVSVLEWLWEAIQGDFNQERSTGQIVFDTAISMIPGVDQVCDVRDIVANCKQINDDKTNTWAWVGLCLTLVGLIPTLGSLLKGVFKIFFLFVRRMGGNAVVKAVDETMTWVITLLRKREVMKYWRAMGWDNVLGELAKQAKVIRGKVNTAELLRAFDRGIALMNNLVDYVKRIPVIGAQAKATVAMVQSVRKLADEYVGKALKPVLDVMDAIIRRLELEDLVQRRGVVNVGNIHFRGNLPEARAVTLMRNAEPPPVWLSKGKPTNHLPLDPDDYRVEVDRMAKQDYPALNDERIASFSRGMKDDVLRGPMRLYRMTSPGNTAAGWDWVTEEVWNKILASSDPKATMRKNLAIWPDWNADGQFVIYDLKAGEELKVWRGPASAQTKDPKFGLDDRFLEGGWEQIKFDGAQVFDATGNAVKGADGRSLRKPDDMVNWKVNPATGEMVRTDKTYDDIKKMPDIVRDQYSNTREQIHHPRVLGPFDTGWGATDFDAQLRDVKLGLPALPGQVTNVKQ